MEVYRTREVKKEAKQIAEEFKIEIGVALDLALKAERNEILKRAFVLSDGDSHPSALESIAMNLGQESR